MIQLYKKKSYQLAVLPITKNVLYYRLAHCGYYYIAMIANKSEKFHLVPDIC